MKRVVAILILLLFSYRCVYQFSVVAWYELNKERIAKTLCENRNKPQLRCNGKCYLRKQLNKVSGTDQVPGKPQSQKAIEWSDFVAADKLSFVMTGKPVSRPFTGIYQRQYHFLHSADIFHPPPHV